MSAFIPKFWGSHNKHNSEEWFMSLKHMPIEFAVSKGRG